MNVLAIRLLFSAHNRPAHLANGYEISDALDVVRVRPVDILHKPKA